MFVKRKNPSAVALGGKARAAKLSAERQSEIGKVAGQVAVSVAPKC
jgi:hypothetical protein